MSQPFDLQRLRAQFPILQQSVHGQPLVYLDNAATTHKPQAVLDAMQRYYCAQNANVHRASHALSARATAQFEAARATVQQFLHADSLESIIWTRGATEAINLVAQSWGRANLRAGDEILLSAQEHHANIVPWQLLAGELGFTIKVLPLQPSGELDMAQLPALLSHKTKLLGVCHVSNALGIINPVAELIARAQAVGAKVLVDGAQAVAHLPVDVQQLDCDFYVFSGHKLFAPTGIGVLYGKRELLEAMPPWQGGGEMIEQVSFAGSRFQPAPFKFEAGTPAIAEAIGLAAAIEFVQTQLGQAQQHEAQLHDYASARLRDIPGLRIVGDVANKTAIISLRISGHHPHDIASALDQQGIALRSGHHCAMPLMQALGIDGTLRISLAAYNSHAEIDVLVRALRELLQADSAAPDSMHSSAHAAPGPLALLQAQPSHQARYRKLMLLGKASADTAVRLPTAWPHGERRQRCRDYSRPAPAGAGHLQPQNPT